jgi:peptidyl-prolyl cis-trans isomerase C
MKVKVLVTVLFMSTILVGCGGEKGANKENTQVAAKVNGEEVTVHQLNQTLGQLRVKVTQENQAEIKQKALDHLIDQTLVLQAAKEAKLDRNPEVLSTLEAAKQKVLVDAYVQRTLQGVGKPTLQEIEGFYNERPQFFADRKVFVYTQLTMPVEKEALESLVTELKAIKTLAELLPILKGKDISYKKMVEANPSEKLPPALLAPLNVLKVGDIGYLKLSDGLLVIELQQALSQPVTLEQATPAIERQLYSQKQKEAAEKLIESLKESAQVEYLGQFAPKP